MTTSTSRPAHGRGRWQSAGFLVPNPSRLWKLETRNFERKLPRASITPAGFSRVHLSARVFTPGQSHAPKTRSPNPNSSLGEAFPVSPGFQPRDAPTRRPIPGGVPGRTSSRHHRPTRIAAQVEYRASPLRTKSLPRRASYLFRLRAFAPPRLRASLRLLTTHDSAILTSRTPQSGRSRDPQCSFRVCVLGVVSSVAAPAAEWAPSALPWSNHVCGFCGE